MMNYAQLVEEMERGERHMLILGRGGAGKSHTIRTFLQNTNRKVLVTAPSGIATLEIPGSITNHVAFGLRPTVALPWEWREMHWLQKMELKKYDTWLLDEVSMVRNDVLNLIDRILREAREVDLPFGGIRLIFVGDLLQLPPVAMELDLDYIVSVTKGHPESNFNLLQSRSVVDAVANRGLSVFELRGSFRQGDSEQAFLGVLDRIRLGIANDADLAMINSRVIHSNPQEHPVLTSTRKARDLFNFQGIRRLASRKHISKPRIEWSPGEYPIPNLLDDFPAAQDLVVAEGMRIIFNKNDKYGRWVNGTAGRIFKVETSEDREISRVEVLIDGEFEPVYVVRDDFKLFVPGYDEVKGRDYTRVIVTANQFPFEPGYASTIHKSQGRTMDAAVIYLGHGAFAPGQLYVGLSRVKSFAGLFLAAPITREDLIVDHRIVDFYRKVSPKLIPVYP